MRQRRRPPGIYGMGERQTIEILHRIAGGEPISEIKNIRGTCYLTEPANPTWGSSGMPIVSTGK